MESVTPRLAVAGLLMVLQAFAAQAGPPSRAESGRSNEACGAPTASIYLKQTRVVDLFEESRAIYVASRVFQRIGVRLNWHQGTPRPEALESGCGELIELQVDGATPENYFPGALAYATPRESSGTRIHIFYDRVSPMARHVRNLYGYVLAHEIAHVLQGHARHSAEGIMKGHWDGGDYDVMGVYGLRFTSEDTKLILDRARVNRGVAASPAESGVPPLDVP